MSEESAWAKVDHLLDQFDVLARDLERPDPWKQGDDYGEGYTDGKNAAARRIRAVLAGEALS